MYVTKVELANGIWYRVRGCNRDTRQAAESMKAELKTKYNVDSLVVNVQ
jgi:cell division protein FtsN